MNSKLLWLSPMMNLTKLLLLPIAALTLVSSAHGQAGGEVVRGPFLSATVRAPKSNNAIAMKGIVVTVGADRKGWMCYDTDLMRVSMAWTGEFLDFGNTLNQIAWPPPPQVKGTPVFSTEEGPGWAKGKSLADPRASSQGPLPKDWAHYEGLYENAELVVFKYTVGRDTVLETPGMFQLDGQAVFTRTIQFTSSASGHVLRLADGLQGSLPKGDWADGSLVSLNRKEGGTLTLGAKGLPRGSRLELNSAGSLVLNLGRAKANVPFRLSFSADPKPSGFGTVHVLPVMDLRSFTKGGPSHWPGVVEVKGTRGDDKEAYTVDWIAEPASNPYNAKTFFGGFDFFADGRAAICTFHGDVWIVSGIDDKLEALTWKRYATGLFQPLGLKIVKNQIYVLGRDQITRLHDLNGDDEADFYENFNNDTIVTPNYHEFCLDLHTDNAGNFYFAKGAPWQPDVTSPHQGCLFRVSRDGSKLDVIATGLRAPNGMTVGPKDQITVSDNQGHWMPASKLNWVVPGGFYGMTPAAHRELLLERDGTNFVANPSNPADREQFHFKSWDKGAPQPVGYNRPLCWLPMNADNSSGGQVWVDSKRWGPLRGHLLFMSYGKCTLYEVMLGETLQAAMVQIPLKFQSGIMRGRFNPRDGQLYLCGLKGWQTSATRDGGFYRVRYTGQPVRLPLGVKMSGEGIELSFASALDPKTANDAGSYSIERWNYRWTGAYGSPEYSVSNPSTTKHDKLEVTGASLSKDGKTVTLRIKDMKPADQIKIRYNLDAADGTEVSQEIYATADRLEAGK